MLNAESALLCRLSSKLESSGSQFDAFERTQRLKMGLMRQLNQLNGLLTRSAEDRVVASPGQLGINVRVVRA